MRPHQFAFLPIMFALSACTVNSASNTTKPDVFQQDRLIQLNDEQIEKLQVKTAPVETKHLPVELLLPAVVQANPNLTTPVISLVPGRVEDVKVQQGDLVTKGQLLARVRSDEVGQIENECLAKILELQAERKQVDVRAQLARKIYERKKLLVEAKIGARAEMEVAQSELEQAEAALQAIEDKWQSNLISTRQRLRLFGLPEGEVDRLVRTRNIQHIFAVTAPRSGIIILRDVDPGELIEADKALFQVSDLSRVWLVAQVFEKDVTKVRRGLPVRVKVDSLPKEVFSGTLDFVDSRIEPTTRTLPVRATIDNPMRLLVPEMFARLIVKVDTTSALVIPAGAVQQIGESLVVYVEVSPHTYQEKKVGTSRNLGDKVEIVSGLLPSDTVVVQGSVQLLGQSLQRLNP